jgi:hypothetical protein
MDFSPTKLLHLLFLGTWTMYTSKEAYYGKAIVLRGLAAFLWVFALACFALIVRFPEMYVEISKNWEKGVLGLTGGAIVFYLIIYGVVAVKYQTIKLKRNILFTGSRAKKLGYFYCAGGLVILKALAKFVTE